MSSGLGNTHMIMIVTFGLAQGLFGGRVSLQQLLVPKEIRGSTYLYVFMHICVCSSGCRWTQTSFIRPSQHLHGPARTSHIPLLAAQ